MASRWSVCFFHLLNNACFLLVGLQGEQSLLQMLLVPGDFGKWKSLLFCHQRPVLFRFPKGSRKRIKTCGETAVRVRFEASAMHPVLRLSRLSLHLGQGCIRREAGH